MYKAVSTQQPFLEHVRELRRRFFLSTICLILLSIVGYYFHTALLSFLTRPLQKPLYYTSPAGGFEVVLKISLLFGFLLSLPIILYHTLKFLEPAVPTSIKKMIPRFMLASCILLLFGVSVAYFLALPAALHFLDAFTTKDIQSLITTSDYFSFVIRYLVGFGLLFQLPLIMLLINIVSPLQPKKLLRYLRFVIVGSFVLAAIITPTPDFMNQSFMAMPIILLYAISVLIIWYINGSKQQKGRQKKDKSSRVLTKAKKIF